MAGSYGTGHSVASHSDHPPPDSPHTLRADTSNSFLSARLELLLLDAKVWGVNTQAEALAFLGQRFRTVMTMHGDVSDVKVCWAI